MAINVWHPDLGSIQIVPNWPNAGPPTNGVGGTRAGFAQPGDLLTDTTNLNLYINKGTSASPTWTQITIP